MTRLKLILSGLAVILVTVACYAATYTTRAELQKPARGATNWDVANNGNFDIIDSSFALLAGTQTFTAGQTLSSATINSLRTNKIIISTAVYSGLEPLVVYGTSKFFGLTGAVLSLCDQNATNCTNLNLETGAPYKGIVVSTISPSIITPDIPSLPTANRQSILIGQGVASIFSGNSAGRPIVAVGPSALANITTGYADTAVGYGTLSSISTGSYNTAVGDFAGAYIEQGNYNLFLGNHAGTGNGSSNYTKFADDVIFIGQYTGGYSSGTYLGNAGAIGAGSKVGASNSLSLGCTSGNCVGSYTPFNVGIGTDVPRGTLHIIGKDTNNYSLIVSSSGDSGSYHLRVSTPGVVSAHNLAADTALSANYLSSGQCVQSDSTGKLISAGAACGTGSGGGGSSTLQITRSGVQITSPTASVSFNSLDFLLAAVGTTSQILLNPATTDFIHNQGTLQSGAVSYPDYIHVGTSATVEGSGGLRSVYEVKAGSLTVSGPSSFAVSTMLLSVGTTLQVNGIFKTSSTINIQNSVYGSSNLNCLAIDSSSNVVKTACSGGTGSPGGSLGQIQYYGVGTTLAGSTYTFVSSTGVSISPPFDLVGLSTVTYGSVFFDMTTSTTTVGVFQKTSKTAAQLGLLTPVSINGVTTGQEYYCTDCTNTAVCISTGSAQGAFSRVASRTGACN